MTNSALCLDDSSWATASVMLGIGEAIDGSSLEDLRRHIRKIPIAPRRLSLDCGPVRSIEPVGAALLWLLCVETERSTGTRISLIDLPSRIIHRLRSHPLLEYVAGGDELFQDPFGSERPSDR
jgi:hypothetical protein